MTGTLTRISFVAMIGCLLAAACLAQTAPTSKGLSEAEELELKTLTGQLSDPQRQPRTRTEAAELLLSRGYPQAADALKSFLADSSNRGAQIAVAEAVARRGEGRREFIDPLTAMLTGEEASVRSAAARALAVYRNDGVMEHLLQIARDDKRSSAIRLEVIASLQRVLEQKVVGALVGLLEDHDPAIVAAAADSLGRLTNLRSFGADLERWRAWWRQNQGKGRTEWLEELAGSLARSQADLEAENSRLLDRLGKAMEDLYVATPPNQRDAALLGYLKDSLGDVRLAAARLIEKRIASAEPVSPELRGQVKAMLLDADPRARQRAALLIAALGEPEAGKALLERLATEEVPEVRKALLAALGQVADPACLPAVLAEVKTPRGDVAAAAARAVGRLAAKRKLDGAALADTVKALSQRYQALARAEDGVDLPEAILTAMGAVASEEFLPVLVEATKDPAATVRLAAVSGLKAFTRPEVSPVLAGMLADPDRGVRQAAIATLGTMDGPKNLQVILARTDPAVETDAGVRQQAWDSGLAILAQADAATIKGVVEALASRADAADPRIKLRQALVGSLRSVKSEDLPEALRQLGQDLLKAGRPSEAAPALGEAHAAMAAAKSPKAMEVWQEWVEAMVAADDPSVAKALADQSDLQAYAEGLRKLLARLEVLTEKGKWQVLSQVCAAAGNHLSGRLSEEQARLLQAKAGEAKSKLAEADRQRVPALVAQLASGEEAARKAAAGELQAMGERSVAPLLEELKKVLSAEAESRAVESAVLEVLKQVAPKLTGYDSSAPKVDRLKTVEGWMKR